MIVHPEEYADRGCWISDDRVYAFVSSAIAGIAEIGYHGAQPTSRNARIFVSATGVCRFAVSTGAGIQHQLAFDEFDWSPGSIHVLASSPIGSLRLEISTSGRNITVAADDVTGEMRSLTVQLDKRSLFTGVHGRRTWSKRPGKTGWARFSLRDQILLDEWMKREGPYGSDFLIPEPLRRRIYRRRVRSGSATSGDLLPEFQDSPLPIYDAQIQVDMGGKAYDVSETGELTLFTTPIAGATSPVSPFMVCFDADVDIRMSGELGGVESAKVTSKPPSTPAVVPTMRLPGFRRIEEFFSTVPGLVESCVVRDYGIPRATPGGYYWIWAWDAMVTALAALRWGATGLAERTAQFVEAHRDEDCIPMRWTHSLDPLDSQTRGALETLLGSLVYSLAREMQGGTMLIQTYPRMVNHLEEITARCDRRGLFPNIGFYPDLPLRFGRTEGSAVAMEIAAFYAFCRVCENSALHLGDQDTARLAEHMMSVLEHSFLEVFWDKRRNFLVDAVDRKTGFRNLSYPLFTMLFLHHSPALQLIRSHMTPSANFIAKHLVTPAGMRLVPAWDRNAGSETVSGAWYPHWDAYAISLLRRTGSSAEIITWLGSVEHALERLGYAPEYLSLSPSLARDPAAWLGHGSASNLNCATGWYQALLGGVFGLAFDPGGLTIVPLGLPLGETVVTGIYHLGTRWNVKSRHTGGRLQELRVDGQVQEGCLKLPKGCHDGGEHHIELLYGETLPGPHFVELANAEVLAVDSRSNSVEVVVHALGQVDLVFSAPTDWFLTVDGKRVGAVRSELEGRCSASLPMAGEHSVRISGHV